MLDEIEKGIEGTRDGKASAKPFGLQRAFDGVRMQVEFGGDRSDLPMLGEKETANGGNQFRRDHCFPGFVKRVEKPTHPAAKMADDVSEIGKEPRFLWLWGRGNQRRLDLGKSEGRLGTLIRHGFSAGAGERAAFRFR